MQGSKVAARFCREFKSTRWRDYPVEWEVWSRGSLEMLLCSASVSLFEALDVQQGFTDLGRSKFAAAQRCISSGMYQSSGSFMVSGREVALRWLYRMDSSEQWGKRWCPASDRLAVKRNTTGTKGARDPDGTVGRGLRQRGLLHL